MKIVVWRLLISCCRSCCKQFRKPSPATAEVQQLRGVLLLLPRLLRHLGPRMPASAPLRPTPAAGPAALLATLQLLAMLPALCDRNLWELLSQPLVLGLPALPLSSVPGLMLATLLQGGSHAHGALQLLAIRGASQAVKGIS